MRVMAGLHAQADCQLALSMVLQSKHTCSAWLGHDYLQFPLGGKQLVHVGGCLRMGQLQGLLQPHSQRLPSSSLQRSLPAYTA